MIYQIQIKLARTTNQKEQERILVETANSSVSFENNNCGCFQNEA